MNAGETSKKRRWIRPLILAAFAYMLLRWFEHSQVYHPSRAWDGDPARYGMTFEDLSIPVGKNDRVSAWFLPANRSNTPNVFLVCHGNGGNISDRLDLARLLLDCGPAVMLFDYRGYGKSTGRAGEEKSYEDSQAAYRWLREKGFAPASIIAYGESLGGGVAAELALREKTGGLILQSAFTSTPDLGAELFPFLPVHLLATIKYDTRKKLPMIHAPVLVMHGRADTLIPYHHGRNNFAAANEPKLFAEIAGDHNDGVFTDPGLFKGAIGKFLQLPR
jgi:pimeloyl-ACP methyl ester carboxylesterase